MKILNFGSLNLDFTYRLAHIVQPGETITSRGLEIHPGGKGLNQSVALAKAGAEVYHAGQIGEDGELLKKICRENGVDTRYIKTVSERSGNAIIQIDEQGQNCIILFPGANRTIGEAYVDEVLGDFTAGDWLLLQNEISSLPYLMERASRRGMKIILNPSPMDEHLKECDLSRVSLFLMNEIEGFQLTGQTDPDEILDCMAEIFPGAETVLTLGEQGAVYSDGRERIYQKSFPSRVVDTTGAGDTFSGYFIAEYLRGGKPGDALKLAALAAAVAVSRAGAATAIPAYEEIRSYASENGIS